MPASSADGVAWNLADLYSGLDDPRLDRDLDEALKRAEAFSTNCRGKVAVPGGPASGRLARRAHDGA